MRRRALLGSGAAALLSRCGSPATTYYTLAAVPGVPVPGGPHSVQLRRPGLAGYLDRNGIVRRAGGYRLDVASTEAWGEPLGDMLARVLAEDLQSRLPGSSVFTEAGGLSTEADATIEIDVQRFDSGQEQATTLLAQVAVQRGTNRADAVSRSIRLTAQPQGSSTAALVATLSQLLGQLADQIAFMLAGTERRQS